MKRPVIFIENYCIPSLISLSHKSAYVSSFISFTPHIAIAIINNNNNNNSSSSCGNTNANSNNEFLCSFGKTPREDLLCVFTLLSTIGLSTKPQKLINWYTNNKQKARIITKITFDDDSVRIPLSIVKNNYIISHYNAADLSMLSDFEVLKEKLSIVNKSFITLGKPLKWEGCFIYIRDTILLAPAGASSLGKLGKLYEEEGDFTKREISSSDISNMRAFLERDPKMFEEYAIQDAVISLKHALAMEDFNFKIKQLGVPVTLSSVGKNYVFDEWSNLFEKTLNYQISGDFLMGNADELQTPKGLFASGDIGAHMSYFIANYKGGRNESFMYGGEESTKWYDYDLISAYTTGMSDLSLPDYHQGTLINPKELTTWNTNQFLNGYLIVNCNFKFPCDLKYPSIPCYIDKTTTVYPLNGSAYLTGPEYLLAKHQGCVFDIKSVFYIKPKEKISNKNGKVLVELIKPFNAIIKNIQSLRRKYVKGTLQNTLYKEMGNSIYGNVVRGISSKKSFDSLTGKMFRVSGTELSNPILASWTTAFIRSVIGECLHNIHKLGGRVVSVTTDGFITDLVDLENKLLTLPEEDTILFTKYRNLRFELANESNALEVKSSGRGILSWSTRGQLGIESTMVAATGFQRLGYEKRELLELFKSTLNSKEKFFEYTRKSLRSAKDIFKKGGNVTVTLKDQAFRLFYDNRRKIIEPLQRRQDKLLLLDSEPLRDIYHCKSLRFLSKFPITLPYYKNNNKISANYKSSLEVGVRNFIKAYYCKNEKFGLNGFEFRYAKDMVSFIYDFKSNKDIKVSIHSISKLKNRKMIWHPVPPTKENIQFVDYIKSKFPYFREDLFLKNHT